MNQNLTLFILWTTEAEIIDFYAHLNIFYTVFYNVYVQCLKLNHQ